MIDIRCSVSNVLFLEAFGQGYSKDADKTSLFDPLESLTIHKFAADPFTQTKKR